MRAVLGGSGEARRRELLGDRGGLVEQKRRERRDVLFFPNRKNFTSAPFAAVFAAGRTSTGVGSPLGQPSSPKSTSKGFYSAPFATVYGLRTHPSSPASKM